MRVRLTLISLLISLTVFSQDYSALQDVMTGANKSTSVSELDNWWSTLKNDAKIPFVVEDSVYFFYRGEAKTVQWMGDFNGWGYQKEFDNKGKKISNTNIWYLKCSFPKDARLDYKILIDDINWILDPENKDQQWSGVGGGSPNSELRMPNWHEDQSLIERPEIPKGKIATDFLLNSTSLGYQVTYSVYLPYQYEKMDKLPTIYLTDGYEYLHPQLGNMKVALDNLIYDKKIKPVIAVFVDNREPVNRANNRRMNELAMNTKYLNFFVDELIPKLNLPSLPFHMHKAEPLWALPWRTYRYLFCIYKAGCFCFGRNSVTCILYSPSNLFSLF